MKTLPQYRLTPAQHKFIQAIRSVADPKNKLVQEAASQFPFAMLNAWAKKAGYSICPLWIMAPNRKVSRGVYSLPEFSADPGQITVETAKIGRPAGSTKSVNKSRTKASKTAMIENTQETTPAPTVQSAQISMTASTSLASASALGDTVSFAQQFTSGDSDSFVPTIDSNYINWGYHNEIKKIIKSSEFCPMFITGMSGNGKTTMIEQVCAQLNRECIRVNLTAQTDEDELIGGFRLQNGATIFCPGPALVAMQRGAVLLLDEVDLATHLVMCLQSILEGKGKFIPKIGKFVRPAKGFTIVATANTKGKGSEDGRFIGTNQMNEAFLERFRFCYEQDYASVSIEKKIVQKYATTLGVQDENFVNCLVNWADIIRRSFKQQIVSEIITTRRLRDIVFAYSIFGNKMNAIERCVARFDGDTKTAFMDFYTKCDAESGVAVSQDELNDSDVPADYITKMQAAGHTHAEAVAAFRLVGNKS